MSPMLPLRISAAAALARATRAALERALDRRGWPWDPRWSLLIDMCIIVREEEGA